jgi:hypothetical protein
MELIVVPDALLDRVQTFCEKKDIDIQEFIIDAITEKLERAHQERRKKPRL